ncbi:MAG: hypothetical protein ACO2XZ_04595 [Rickettsiales bacterium]
MLLAFFKIFLTALIISFSAWLAAKKPELAGFIIALPLASILVLAITQLEHQNSQNSIILAKSILIGTPISYLFFLPFFLADKLASNFWLCYVIGLILLIIGYFLHKFLTNFIN